MQDIYYMEKQSEIKKKVLFVCAENSGRSKMAEAFFNAFVSGKHPDWVGESAGTFPAHQINPNTIQVMEEVEISIENTIPRAFIPDKASEYTRLVSFGCIVKSSFSPKIQQRIEEWHIEDPKDKPITEVRAIRDEVEKYVNKLVKTL